MSNKKNKKRSIKKKNINNNIPYPIFLAIGLAVILIFVVLNGNSKSKAVQDENAVVTAAVTASPTSTVTLIPTETAVPTTVPESIVNNVDLIKKNILESGYTDDEGIYYIGAMYGESLYCSVRYDKENDILCLQNSYYTMNDNGDYFEALSVWDNFPYSSYVEYYEDYYGTSEQNSEYSYSKGTLVSVAGFDSASFTSSAALTFIEVEESTYQGDNAEEELKMGEKYTLMSFSMWDDLLERVYSLNLKDFGLINFVRDDFLSE